MDRCRNRRLVKTNIELRFFLFLQQINRLTREKYTHPPDYANANKKILYHNEN